MAWLRETPLFAIHGHAGLTQSRTWLELAARACPEPQMAPNCCSSPPWSRRIFEKCRSNFGRSHRMPDGCLSSLPWNSRMIDGCSARHSGAQNARQLPLEPALEPAHAPKMPLEPTAVTCVRFLRSKWPLEKCCLLIFCLSASKFARIHLASCILRGGVSWLSLFSAFSYRQPQSTVEPKFFFAQPACIIQAALAWMKTLSV